MKQKVKQMVGIVLKLALFMVFIGIWTYLVHEPSHYIGCSAMGMSADYNFGFPSPHVACEGVIEAGDTAAFLYWGAPYIIGVTLTVLYAIFSLGILHNKFSFAPRLFRYVIFIDFMANFFDYANSDFHMIEMHSSSTFTLLAFCIVALVVILNMVLIRRDLLQFKRAVAGPPRPFHHDYVATIEEVKPEFTLERVD